ncbi:MAG: tetratricopeptide repeat protein [Cyanobacteria bacterium SZAS LIN-2]|nr:tetratricopeptide repeat protein [Cyanobacteria bacterium SZAS LIN-2]
MDTSEGPAVATQDRAALAANWQNLSQEGYTAFEKRRYVQAETRFQDALKIAESLTAGKDAAKARSEEDRQDFERLTKSLNNLAALYHLQAKYEMAEAMYERCLDLKLALYGDDHLEVAVNLHNLAALSCAKLRWEKAEILYKRALEIREKHLGVDHAELVPILKNYAIMLRRIKRDDEAAAMEERKSAIEAAASL